MKILKKNKNGVISLPLVDIILMHVSCDLIHRGFHAIKHANSPTMSIAASEIGFATNKYEFLLSFPYIT